LKTLLAVSPHLDDAVFSAGALLARRARAGWRVVVATCFTASVPNPTGFALACQLDKGLGPQVDYMALRREEDRNACALLGAEAVHLPFPEAPHRGYGSAAALFGPRLASDRMADTLSEALADMIAACEPNLLLGPAAIGDHVDHWIVREALAGTASAPAAVWPTSLMQPATAPRLPKPSPACRAARICPASSRQPGPIGASSASSSAPRRPCRACSA
jgi:LmbE family N-acetylglucosaminyl deacetylase